MRDKQQREVDFLVTKDKSPFMLVECKTSMQAPLSPSLVMFQKSLSVPYAFQVAMDGEQSGIDVMDYRGQAIKVSARDFLGRLI